MKRGPVIALGVVFSFVVLLYLWVSNSTALKREESHLHYTNQHEILEQKDDPNGLYFYPDNWNGLPISIGNPLFVKQSQTVNALRKELVKKMRKYPEEKWESHDWMELVHEYVPLVGWNGFCDSMDEAKRKGTPYHHMVIHMVGELIAADTNVPEFAVEVSARETLHKAAFHGVVWSFIKDSPYLDNPFELMKYIDSRLCYFHSNRSMQNIWISCAHGVGHGLGQVYQEKVDKSVAVCAEHSNYDFKYTCVTGIFMDLQTMFDSSVAEPCDRLLYPAGCFRYKIKYYKAAIKEGIQFPCNGMDDYHKRGCIFGEGHALATAPGDVKEICQKYYPTSTPDPDAGDWRDYMACLEGVWQGKKVYKLPDVEKFCAYWEVPFLRDLCLSHKKSLIDEDSELEKWNSDILERL